MPELRVNVLLAEHGLDLIQGNQMFLLAFLEDDFLACLLVLGEGDDTVSALCYFIFDNFEVFKLPIVELYRLIAWEP